MIEEGDHLDRGDRGHGGEPPRPRADDYALLCCGRRGAPAVRGYPGEMQGRYASDMGHVVEVIGATMRGFIEQYLEKYVRSVGSHAEMMDKLVGYQRIREMTGRATIKEGYGV